jgi:hypothetical protein
MKKSVSRRETARHYLNRLGGIHQSCRNIATLAELLEHGDGELLQPRTVASAGAMIGREMKTLQKALDALAQIFPQAG